MIKLRASSGQEGPMILELPTTTMTTTRRTTKLTAAETTQMVASSSSPRNHPRRSRRSMASVFVSSPLVLVMTAYTFFQVSFFFFSARPHQRQLSSEVVPPPIPLPPPATCTTFDLDIIQRQLPVEDCHDYQTRPWYNKCSFSYATRCPDATFWLGPQYNQNNDQNNENKNVRTTKSRLADAATGRLGGGGGSGRGGRENGRRIAIYVGCNKALDAVNTLRMLSGDPRFDKTVWRNALFRMDQPQDNSNGTTVPPAAAAPRIWALRIVRKMDRQATGTTTIRSTVSKSHCMDWTATCDDTTRC
jgi:hypothetical protein